jgi:hypothetical protein
LAVILGIQFVQLVTTLPGIYIHASDQGWIVFSSISVCAAFLTATCLTKEPVFGRYGFALVFGAFVFLALWVLYFSPSPKIDVYYFQRDSVAKLLRFENPYTYGFNNIYSHEKFYGIVRSLTVLDKSFFFYEGKRIDPHEYMYVLKVSNRLLFREDVTIDSSATETNENFDGLEPQEGHFDTYNLAWEIIVAPKDGWIPAVVFIPSLAGSIVLSLLISALTFVSFVKIEQHEFILNQMLPKRSVTHLALMKSGSNHAFAEEFQTSVPNAILIDAGTNTVLYEKAADAPVAPAATVDAITVTVCVAGVGT